MDVKFYRQGSQVIVLCIDAYENAVPQGRFYTQVAAKGVGFCGATDLLRKLGDVLEEMDIKKLAGTVPLYDIPSDERAEVTVEVTTGKIATFNLCILFRQHSSWQGSLTWMEGRQEQSFRSVLELLLLMDSALTCEKPP